MTALAAANGIFGGIFRAAEGQNAAPGDKRCTPTCFGANVPGLGDRALRLPKLGLNVLQGEILVRVIPGPLPAPIGRQSTWRALSFEGYNPRRA